MLPDYPDIKNKIEKRLHIRMKNVMLASMVPFAQVPRSRVFEGDKLVLVREDGSLERTELRKVEVIRQVEFKEVERMTPKMVIQRIDEVARDMGFQQSKVFFEEVNKAVHRSGNIIDVGNRPFCADDYFKMLEMLQIDFGENGEPFMPTIVAGDKVSEGISKVLQEVNSDPSLRKRKQEIVERKREQWRDRESDRKLVG